MATRRHVWPLWLLLGLGTVSVLVLWVKPRRADPETVYERALTAIEGGRIAEADRALTQLAALRDPTALDWGVRARVAIARGQVEQALAALARIPDTHPLAGWAHLRAGQLDLRRWRLRPAENQLRRALAIEPEQIEARRELIYLLGVQLRRRDLDEHFQRLALLSTLTPKEVWVWCMVRDLAWWQPVEHGEILRKALAADPDDRHSRLALAENLRRTGRHEEALSVLARLPEDDSPARAARAGLALEHQDVEAAQAILDGGPPGDPILAPLRGRLALQRGAAAVAVQELESALAFEPGRRGTTADLGRAYILTRQPDRGRPLLDTAARIDALDNLLLKSEMRLQNPDGEFLRTLGSACEAAGRLPEARAWYALAVSRNPLDPPAQQALARLSPPSRQSTPTPASK